jgi:hypothetical protein
VISNDDYKSVEHRWSSSPYKRLESLLPFFNPVKCDDSDFFGSLAELVTKERPLDSTLPEFTLPKLLIHTENSWVMPDHHFINSR